MYALVVVAGPDAGTRFPLPDREPQLVGRSTEAIPLGDDSVSRRHAELTPDDGRWWIRDLDSTNGTSVNGRPVLERTPLQPGDRIRCGDTEFQLRHLDESLEHGRLRAPDPAETRVEIVRPDIEVRDRPDWTDILARDATPGDRVAALARIVGAETAVMVPIDARGLCLEGVEVRHADGTVPEEAFDLPRELLSALATEAGPLLARLDGRSTVAGVRIEGRPDRVLVARLPEAATWCEARLRDLALGSLLLGMEVGADDRAALAIRTERLAAMGEATAALSHSVKNILQGMRGGADAVELALARERLDLAREGWAILARNLDRILSLSLNMLAYSKERALDIVPTRIGDVAVEVTGLLQGAAARAGTTLHVVVPDDEPPIPVDPDAVHQVILNLVGNGLEASDRGGRVEVRVEYDPDAVLTTILVCDRGPGVPLDRRDRIFEPFYSTRGQRGTGLGLAVARKLVERHGGTLRLDPPDGVGACFRVTLPAARDDEPGAEGTRAPNPIQGGELGVRFES